MPGLYPNSSKVLTAVADAVVALGFPKGKGIRLVNGFSQDNMQTVQSDLSHDLSMSCIAFYIGKTIHKLGLRMRDHLYYYGGGKIVTPVTRHIGLHHRFDNTVISFFVLEVIPPNPRGGDWDNAILRAETYWIEKILSPHPSRD